MTQLLLPLVTRERNRLEHLILHEGNEAAVAAIRAVLTGSEPPLPSIFIFGPPGCGKTHLLKASANLLETTERRGGESGTRFISFDAHTFPGDAVEGLVGEEDSNLDRLAGVALDDVHLAGSERSALILTLFNKLSRSGACLMMASRLGPSELWADNPHLESRVSAGLVLGLEPPEDNVRVLIVDKLARDRHVRVSEDICRFLVTRKSRNIKDLEAMLDVLDRVSLERKRRITIPFIKTLEEEGIISQYGIS